MTFRQWVSLFPLKSFGCRHSDFFQQDLFALAKTEAIATLKILRKISQLTWEQLYKDRGLKWKMIRSKQEK